MAGFYRHFIRNYADFVEPLNDLTRKNARFTWSKGCDYAFQHIIKLLSEKPILAYPNSNEKFYLSTDASNMGIGAVLGQKDNQGHEHPIQFASRTLNQAARIYSTIERELLAIVDAADKFRYYLYGKKFTIITDHNPLVYLKNITLSSERLTRWRLKLAEYDFDIEYRRGSANGNADAMSRIETDIENEPINVKIEHLFSIIVGNDTSINKELFFEELNYINDQEDNIKYSDKNIFESQHDEAIAFSIQTNINNIDGIARDIYRTNGGSSCLKKHNLNVGSAIVKKDKRTIFFLITKKLNSDNPSYETLSSCLKQIKEICKENNIIKLAFPKHGGGLDKLC
jgi:hypothetical protein